MRAYWGKTGLRSLPCNGGRGKLEGVPTYPPRANSAKKREQLLKRKQELQHAIRVGAPRGQLAKSAEKLRSAQLAFLKAELCWVRETRLRNFRVTELSCAAEERIANIEKQARRWESGTIDEILCDAVLP
jgi:hypothetical protein